MFSWRNDGENPSAIEEERPFQLLLAAYRDLYEVNLGNLPMVGFLDANSMRANTLYVGPPYNMSPRRPERKLAELDKLVLRYVRKKRRGRAAKLWRFWETQAAELVKYEELTGNVWSMDTGDSKYYRGVLKPSSTIVRPKATSIRGAGRAAQQTKWYLMRGFRDSLSFYKPQEVATWFVPKEELQEKRQPLRVENTHFFTKRVTVAAMSETVIDVPEGSRGVRVQAERAIEADTVWCRPGWFPRS